MLRILRAAVRRQVCTAGFGNGSGRRQVCAAVFGEMCVFVSMLPGLLEGHGLTEFGLLDYAAGFGDGQAPAGLSVSLPK